MGGIDGSSLARHRTGADCGAVKAVSAGQPTDEDGEITGFGPAFPGAFCWDKTDRVSQCKALSRIPGMESVDGEHHRNAHGIGVIGRAPDGIDEDRLRMESAFGHVFPLHPRIPQSHDGAASDGPSALAATQCIPDHTPVFRHDAAVGTDGCGRIVRFTFDRQCPSIVEFHGSCVVLEHGQYEGMVDFVRCLPQRLEEAEALPRCVETVVGPRLGEHFEFGIGQGAFDFI